MILGLWIIAQVVSLVFVMNTLRVCRDHWWVWFAICTAAFVPPLVSLGFWTDALPSGSYVVRDVFQSLSVVAVLAAMLLAVVSPVRSPKWASLSGRAACVAAAVLATSSSPLCRM